MGDMRVDHQQVIVAYTSDSTALHRAAMNGHAFANTVTVTNNRFGRLAIVFQILVRFAYASKLENLIIAADFRMSFDDNM